MESKPCKKGNCSHLKCRWLHRNQIIPPPGNQKCSNLSSYKEQSREGEIRMERDLSRNAGEFPEGSAVSGLERERITCVTTCVRLFASEIVSCLKLYCDISHTRHAWPNTHTHTHTHTQVQIPQSVTAGKTNIDQRKFPFWSRIFYAIQFELDSLKSSKQDCILCLK